MQQRVAIARALAAEGDLLILDEPFKAMDEALRSQVIAKVAQTRAAVLLVTHEMAAVSSSAPQSFPGFSEKSLKPPSASVSRRLRIRGLCWQK